MSTFSNQEYTDIHFIYSFCNDNARTAVTEYHRRDGFVITEYQIEEILAMSTAMSIEALNLLVRSQIKILKDY